MSKAPAAWPQREGRCGRRAASLRRGLHAALPPRTHLQRSCEYAICIRTSRVQRLTLGIPMRWSVATLSCIVLLSPGSPTSKLMSEGNVKDHRTKSILMAGKRRASPARIARCASATDASAHSVSSSLLGPVVPSCRALSGRLKTHLQGGRCMVGTSGTQLTGPPHSPREGRLSAGAQDGGLLLTGRVYLSAAADEPRLFICCCYHCARRAAPLRRGLHAALPRRTHLQSKRLVFHCRTTSASTAPCTPRRTCCPHAHVRITGPRGSGNEPRRPDCFRVLSNYKIPGTHLDI